MNGIIQYVVYVMTGSWFVMMFVLPVYTYAGAAFRVWGLPLLFFPFLLAGYASGLSFLFPRMAAIIATIIASGFLVAGISHLFGYDAVFISHPAYAIAPAVIVISVSALAIREAEAALWNRCKLSGKIILGVFVGLPGLFATSALVVIGSRLFGFGGG